MTNKIYEYCPIDIYRATIYRIKILQFCSSGFSDEQYLMALTCSKMTVVQRNTPVFLLLCILSSRAWSYQFPLLFMSNEYFSLTNVHSANTIILLAKRLVVCFFFVFFGRGNPCEPILIQTNPFIKY